MEEPGFALEEKKTGKEFAVVGSAFGDAKPITIRRFKRQDDAARYALTINMKYWDDVWVSEVAVIPPKSDRPFPPPFPWNVEWVGNYAYLIDANKNKLASLLGNQATREFVAGIICDLSPGGV